MLGTRTEILRVVIGALGNIYVSLEEYLAKITGNHAMGDLQKTAILGTTHIIMKVLF